MKICILTIGTRGDVQPYIALGLGLKEVGHDVTIAALAEFQSLVTSYGLHFVPLRGDFLKAAQAANRGSSGQGRANPLRLIREYTEMAKETLEDEWESARHAEVFIFSPAVMGAFDIAEKLKVPAFAAFPTPLYSPTREFPSPFFPFTDLGPFNKLSHKLFVKLGPALYRRPVNDWRRDVLGLPPARRKDRLNGRTITKLYAYSEFVVPRPADWDPSSVVTGYWFLDAPGNWQPDPALVEFLQEGPPPVYVGFGSMSVFASQDHTQMIQDALKLAGQRGILTGGGEQIRDSIHAGQIFMVHAVPHDWLFPQVAAVVHHGGAGTTGAALRAGKPAVICPFVGDQSFWGRRIASLGVGPTPIPLKKLTAENLAAAIKTAVEDPVMRQRAAAVGKMIRSEDGVGHAVAVIQQHLSE